MAFSPGDRALVTAVGRWRTHSSQQKHHNAADVAPARQPGVAQPMSHSYYNSAGEKYSCFTFLFARDVSAPTFRIPVFLIDQKILNPLVNSYASGLQLFTNPVRHGRCESFTTLKVGGGAKILRPAEGTANYRTHVSSFLFRSELS
jgi:hypothetical protein